MNRAWIKATNLIDSDEHTMIEGLKLFRFVLFRIELLICLVALLIIYNIYLFV